MRQCIIILACMFFSCGQPVAKEQLQIVTIVIPAVTILSTDSLLQSKDGYQYYQGKLFSGTIKEQYPSHITKSIQTFFNGKEEGWLMTYYPDGIHADKRFFHLGEKDSVHTGWWNNGNPRFEHHFKNGNYDGCCKDWYMSGKILKEIWYDHGNDSCGKGWRENGKLFMNFITKNGRRYGLMNGQLCYSLKNGKGEYERSSPDTVGTGSR